MIRAVRMSFLASMILLLGACASTHMMEVPEGQRATGPAPGKALVYFLRPSSFGGAVQSTIYDNDQYIGTVSANTHVAYQADPGKHLFMVIGENADFMQADLVAGKTYSAIVQVRMGVWKARFSLQPNNGQHPEVEIQGWLKQTRQVAVGEEGRRWAQENAASNQQLKAEYLPKWQAKPEGDKQTLHALSGR